MDHPVREVYFLPNVNPVSEGMKDKEMGSDAHYFMEHLLVQTVASCTYVPGIL